VATARLLSGHSPQGNDDEQETNDCDTASVIDPPHIADHETAGGPIYVPQTLTGEKKSCRADKHADKQQHLHFITLSICSLKKSAHAPSQKRWVR
jgi:hypothetical protein